MYNQGKYQQFGQRSPAVRPPFQQAGPPPYGPSVSVPPNGMLTGSQSYLLPPPPNSNWSQSQHILQPILPPGHHFYRVQPLAPPPTSYFIPASFGSFAPPPPPPPPPPPASPPPGPPPPPDEDIHGNNDTIGHDNNDSETSVKQTSDLNIISDIPPPKPRDEKTVRNIEVLCQYIAKNGHEFEYMTSQNEVGNPEFEFLFGGEPGSEAAISHEYFKWMKKKRGSRELLEGSHNRELLKSSGVGTLHADVSRSSAGSDMDMEDDITQPEEHVRDSEHISNEVDTTVEEHARDSERISHNDATDENVFRSESSKVIEQGPGDMHVEKSTTKVDFADSEQSVDIKPEENDINLHQTINQSEQSPFRLIQNYASDDSSENDNEPHFENVSPEPVSPHVEKGLVSLSVPVVEGSLDIASEEVPEPSIIKTEDLDNKTDEQNGRKNGGAQKEESNAKLEIDEFGRIVKEGSSDGDSDDYTTRRRGKRGRSRSRSRSPIGSRRRRKKRHRSRSWSPKKRSRSRSPYSRRNRSHVQICNDFRRGKCFRADCRYIHESVKNEESRRHKDKQRYHDVSDRLKKSDKLVPQKDEVDNHDMPGHSADVATVTAMPGQISIGEHPLNMSPPEPQLAREYNVMPPASLWNSLPPPPPPPPRQQLGGPLPHQPPFQTNYPLQAFITPYGPETTAHLGAYPTNHPILQQSEVPTISDRDHFARISSPNLVSSNEFVLPAGEIVPPGGMSRYTLQNSVVDSISNFEQSRIASRYNPYASTFDLPLRTNFSSGVFNQDTTTSYSNKYDRSVSQNHIPDEGQIRHFTRNLPISGGDQYDPLFDSIEQSSNPFKKTDHGNKESEENDEFGETADAEVGAVENDSPTPSSPIDLPNVATGEIEIDQVKTKKSKDSRSMKLFKISLADFVKEVLKPSWRQGNMSKEAFKTIVKKTVDKVSAAMKKHQIPKSQAKINHYIDSSQRKLTKLVMGYVDKYVKA